VISDDHYKHIRLVMEQVGVTLINTTILISIYGINKYKALYEYKSNLYNLVSTLC
jgi:hypothetical protein